MTNFEACGGNEFIIRMFAEKRVWKGTSGWNGDFEQLSFANKIEAIDKEVEWLKQEYDGGYFLDQKFIDLFNGWNKNGKDTETY